MMEYRVDAKPDDEKVDRWNVTVRRESTNAVVREFWMDLRQIDNGVTMEEFWDWMSDTDDGRRHNPKRVWPSQPKAGAVEVQSRREAGLAAQEIWDRYLRPLSV